MIDGILFTILAAIAVLSIGLAAGVATADDSDESED